MTAHIRDFTTMSSSNPPLKSPTSNVKSNRLPAPTLFVGPPSRNASQLSVSRVPADNSLRPNRDPLARQRSSRLKPEAANNSASNGTGRELPKLRKASDKSIDAKWKEMQNTLNEVELTAQSSTHVFGESHSKALDDLRDAQIALARAWGRGNEEKSTAASDEPTELDINRFKGAQDIASDRNTTTGTVRRRRADTDASGSTVLSDESVMSDDTVRSGRSRMEDETAQDIRLASERRAANEAYFKRVDQGVREVVERLERVAEAMRGVEGESRSLWSESGSQSSGNSAEEGTNGKNGVAAGG